MLARNAGTAARNAGVRRAQTPYVAFSDDDSWWEPGRAGHRGAVLDADPRLGLIAARTLVGPGCQPDPVNAAMARSRRCGTEAAAEVLGFLACACVVRKEAFLSIGGFSELLFFVGEERLLAYDLAAAGWGRRYSRRWSRSITLRGPAAPAPAPPRRTAQRRAHSLAAAARRGGAGRDGEPGPSCGP